MNLLSNRKSMFSTPTGSRPQLAAPRRTFLVEALEDRRLLSAALSAPPILNDSNAGNSVVDLPATAQQIASPVIWQQSKVSASDGAANDGFGNSVAIDGSTMVVTGGGAAYVFIESDSRWLQAAKLTPADPPVGFGGSVSISGETVVVGACSATVGGNIDQGAAYVFTEPAAGWTNMTQTAKLTASDGAAYDDFGGAVSICGNTVVASGGWAAAAYVFTEPANGWVNMTQTAKLNTANARLFPVVSISGNTVVVGSGAAAYLFTEPTSGWVNMTQTATLTTSDGAAGFGYAVSVSGSTVVVGAGSDPSVIDADSAPEAVYVFVEPDSGWADMTQTAKLSAFSGSPGPGVSVSISGDTVVVGAEGVHFVTLPGYTMVGPSTSHSVYLFDKPSSGWADMTETARLVVSDNAFIGTFAASVAISGNTVVAGATDATVGANRLQGAAYVFGATDDQPVYRLCNPANDDHLFTSDLNEYNTLLARGWTSEAAPFDWYVSPATVDGVTDEPMYRLYDPSIRQHLWTTDLNEYTTLATRGWTQEGIAGYVFPTAVAASEPLYRLNDPATATNADLHLWTTDVNEYDTLASEGWTQEGICAYVL